MPERAGREASSRYAMRRKKVESLRGDLEKKVPKKQKSFQEQFLSWMQEKKNVFLLSTFVSVLAQGAPFLGIRHHETIKKQANRVEEAWSATQITLRNDAYHLREKRTRAKYEIDAGVMRKKEREAFQKVEANLHRLLNDEFQGQEQNPLYYIDAYERFELGVSNEERDRALLKADEILEEAYVYAKERIDKGEQVDLKEIINTFFAKINIAQDITQRSMYRLLLTGKGTCEARAELYTFLVRSFLHHMKDELPLSEILQVDTFREYTDLSGIYRPPHVEVALKTGGNEIIPITEFGARKKTTQENRTQWNSETYHAFLLAQSLNLEGKNEEYNIFLQGSPYMREERGDLSFDFGKEKFPPYTSDNALLFEENNNPSRKNSPSEKYSLEEIDQLTPQEKEKMLEDFRDARVREIDDEVLKKFSRKEQEDIKNMSASEELMEQYRKAQEDAYTQDKKLQRVLEKLQKIMSEKMEISDADVFMHEEKRKILNEELKKIHHSFNDILKKYEGKEKDRELLNKIYEERGVLYLPAWISEADIEFLKKMIQENDLLKGAEMQYSLMDFGTCIHFSPGEPIYSGNDVLTFIPENEREAASIGRFITRELFFAAVKKIPTYADMFSSFEPMRNKDMENFIKIFKEAEPVMKRRIIEDGRKYVRHISLYFDENDPFDISFLEEFSEGAEDWGMTIRGSVRGNVEVSRKFSIDVAAKSLGVLSFVTKNAEGNFTFSSDVDVQIILDEHSKITLHLQSEERTSIHLIPKDAADVYTLLLSVDGRYSKCPLIISREMYFSHITFSYAPYEEEFSYSIEDKKSYISFLQAVNASAKARGEVTTIILKNRRYTDDSRWDNVPFDPEIVAWIKQLPNLRLELSNESEK